MGGIRKFLHDELFVGAYPDGRLTVTNTALIIVILLAVATAALSTEPLLRADLARWLPVTELIFGAIFLVEYIARIYAAADQPGEASAWRKRWDFVRSPIGLIDLAVVIFTLAPLLTTDASLLRLVRLLRVVAVMKFGRFSQAVKVVWAAVTERGDDLLVTMGMAFILLLFGATALYLIEGETQPEAFGSIPRALWWSVITFTTVGYGDVYPISVPGKVFGSFMALTGIMFVAMPTGIIASAFSEAMQRRRDQRIEEMRDHISRLDQADASVEAKLAELERLSNSPGKRR